MSIQENGQDSRVERVRAGDRQALANLFAEQEPELRRWVDRRLDPKLRARVSASDVLQEVYLAAEDRLEHFRERPRMPFRVWIRLLADQRLIDLRRRHVEARARAAGAEVRLGAGTPNQSEPRFAAGFAGDLTSPSNAAARRESLEILTEAIEAMEPLDREVLVLRHFDELTNDEVAARLGIPKGTASKRYVRALIRLKDVLETVPGLIEDVQP